ncbi:MAG: cytochrome c3 family protein [Coriobacteriales bacterium]|jgi:hypothetical protein|nr:cytochrome c3 family protein [Coriobacteriales bacterium]
MNHNDISGDFFANTSGLSSDISSGNSDGILSDIQFACSQDTCTNKDASNCAIKHANNHAKKHKFTNIMLITLAPVIIVGIFVLAAFGCAPSGSGGAGEAVSGSASTNNMASAEDDIVAASFSWSMQSDCATCHTSEASAASDSKHVQAAAHEALKCVSCHEQEAVLTKSHDGVSLTDKPATKPTVITVSEKTCIGCHGELADVAELTASSVALKDDQGKIVNPHQRPDGETHSNNPATCTSCHNNHSETLARDAKKYCASCHHRGIWQCGTCHEKRD